MRFLLKFRKVSNSVRRLSQAAPQFGKSETIEICGKKYKRDNWTNVTEKIQSLTDRHLYKNRSSPIGIISQSVRNVFTDYDVFEYPSPVVETTKNFDSLLIPKDHVSRSKSDTYYVNEDYVLRTHTSAHQADCLTAGSDAFVCIADVYRRDHVDSLHFPAFHQCEILKAFTASKLNLSDIMSGSDQQRSESCQEQYSSEASKIVEDDLKCTLESYVKYLLGSNTKTRWVSAYFPFTHPSFELEIKHRGEWVEILGCGVVEHKLLDRIGIQNKIGWAAGFGIERLAMIKYDIPDIRLFWTIDPGFHVQFHNVGPSDSVKYKPPISNHPPVTRDISFWLPEAEGFTPNDFYDLVNSVCKNLVEKVTLIDEFVNKDGKKSNTYRVIYRSPERTMTNVEVNELHELLRFQAVLQLNVDLR